MIFFEKIRNFSALDERDCQAAWLFAHWGQFGRETRAWPDGADPPHFHMHIGKIGQFLEVWVFRGTQVGLCVDGPCKAAGHLQNTPGTPAMHFPLVAAGSQSALYALPPERFVNFNKFPAVVSTPTIELIGQFPANPKYGGKLEMAFKFTGTGNRCDPAPPSLVSSSFRPSRL